MRSLYWSLHVLGLVPGAVSISRSSLNIVGPEQKLTVGYCNSSDISLRQDLEKYCSDESKDLNARCNIAGLLATKIFSDNAASSICDILIDDSGVYCTPVKNVFLEMITFPYFPDVESGCAKIIPCFKLLHGKTVLVTSQEVLQNCPGCDFVNDSWITFYQKNVQLMFGDFVNHLLVDYDTGLWYKSGKIPMFVLNLGYRFSRPADALEVENFERARKAMLDFGKNSVGEHS